MTSERCREWRTSLGAYVLGQLSEPDRVALEAHLDGCPECRAEAEALRPVARLLPLADPSRITAPAPQPSTELGERIAATIDAERTTTRRRQRRRRFAFGFAGVATAAVAAVLAIVALTGGAEETAPAQTVAFHHLPKGVEIDAVLQPHSFGTEIHMYVTGVRSGTLCRVFLRGDDGRRYSAGSFRYRWGEDADTVLSSALDLSSTRAIGVHAGKQTFVEPVGTRGATASVEHHQNQEVPT